ncbi:unannotated protein [freshwater metagenome]|uniref:Unannotated protein n=1 Tax=freshwater metagenome TaxID=449393 RepID=A0A6J6KHR5_9ZZZZ|nr:hypothetical protein [Actinomycetota bacterium]MSZ12607.1 hypothetical protein [Actinomycetota bacterium]MSZ28063.1 hypothetical protein [Actinomycetota bacterium]
MKLTRPIQFITIFLIVFGLANLVDATTSSKTYTESFPAVVCPPTLAGLSSQISLGSTKTQFQRLQDRTAKTSAVKLLRLPVIADSLLVNSEATTPVVWQSRAGRWGGAALCVGPVTSQWFVGASADVTTKGRLVVINSGLSDSIVDIQSFSENGKQQLQTINVKAKNYSVLAVDSFAPGDKALALLVEPQSGRVNSFMLDEQGQGLRSIGGDLINSVSSASKSITIPAIPTQKPSRGQTISQGHTIRVLAPGQVDADITVEVLSTDGVFIPVGLNSRLISAGQVTEFVLKPEASSEAFAIRINATEPIVAAVKTRITASGKSDYVWSTPAPELSKSTMAITGLSPLIVFAGEQVNVSIDLTLVNGKTVSKSVAGNDIVTWKPPSSARSLTITKVNKGIFAGAIVTSVNGIGYFPFAIGSELAKIEIPDSNIQVLNP